MEIEKIDINSLADINSALQMLSGTELSVLDCVRLAKNVLDFKVKNSKLSDIQYCTKVLSCGLNHLHIREMSVANGFIEYLNTKANLRTASFRDIKYIGNRLMKVQAFAKKSFSEITLPDCQKWLDSTYDTPSQFNKAHTMLNGLFNYALRQEWVQRNVIRLIKKRKVVEQQIKALSLAETKSLLKVSQLPEFKDCQAGVALLIWAGIRPQELQRLRWQDIDLDEDIITILPNTSKTGGTRHIEICKALKACLSRIINEEIDGGLLQNSNRQVEVGVKNLRSFDYIQALPRAKVLPPNWHKKWKALRYKAGFKGSWTQDVLRHTYASYHTKHFGDLRRLQLNMGHCNTQLLRTRYVNLSNISKLDAKSYFSIAS